MNKLYVIGIGYKPLDKKAREIVLSAEIILASKRLLEVFEQYDEYKTVKDKILILNNVDETINYIKSRIPNLKSHIVLLASGDPAFFGIGRRTIREFGKDMVEIIPDLSCIQMAFTKIKESWDDAFLMSLHGGPDPEKRRRLPYEITDIPSLLQQHNKIAILTDKENNPSKIAVALNSSFIVRHSSLIMNVCERLGYDDERIISGPPKEIASQSFREPNVVIIQKTEDKTQKTDIVFGLKEDDVVHSRGLITKDEIRAVTLHKSRLPQKGVFWDIGAGSGSVSIEAAGLYPELDVFAIERDEEQINNARTNKIRFNATNIRIIKGEAPDALINLPHPDRVFIGGNGGNLKKIIDFIALLPTKIIVINATTIETLNEAIKCLENKSFEIEISEVSISRSKTIAGKRHMSALNPVFVIVGERL
ncbi:MAG: precorrin-6y C5,15-methyltransferase (decarboxylating) subunit CbiE [Thermodesulfovibrionales bacterium]|nr:precorrin-6y C5,15-methyltransferase (decarboxylating) subunit CbiE [Thermodesulfovibrionales bacterium]